MHCLKCYQGVIAAEIGHVSVHEAGAIEADGHKVLTLPHDNGKISADQVRGLLDGFYNDANHDHMVMPGNGIYFPSNGIRHPLHLRRAD